MILPVVGRAEWRYRTVAADHLATSAHKDAVMFSFRWQMCRPRAAKVIALAAAIIGGIALSRSTAIRASEMRTSCRPSSPTDESRPTMHARRPSVTLVCAYSPTGSLPIGSRDRRDEAAASRQPATWKAVRSTSAATPAELTPEGEARALRFAERQFAVRQALVDRLVPSWRANPSVRTTALRAIYLEAAGLLTAICRRRECRPSDLLMVDSGMTAVGRGQANS